MTLVLGAQCVDGIAIISDRKIVGFMGTFLGNETKMFRELSNVIFGCAGALDMIHLFRRYVVGDVTILRDSPTERYTHDNIVQKLSEIMRLFQRIRLGGYPLEVMVARLSSGYSDLHVIDSRGRIDKDFAEKWVTIGKGKDVANALIKEEFKETMTLRDFGSLSFSIIKYLEELEPDGSVGVGTERPDISYLYHNASSDEMPSDQDWINFEASRSEYYSRFKKITSE